VVAESGIAYRGGVESLGQHADAFLVGSAVMRDADLDRAVRHLVYGRTKVCGLTRPEDARAAYASGATHGGLLFAKDSPRLVMPEQAYAVRSAAPLAWVGVFADQPAKEIAELAKALELQAVQLHGSESREEVERVRALLPSGCEVWKAVRVRGKLPLREETGADRLLLDGWSAGRLGGAGVSFDWSRLLHHAERREVIVAGGLTPDNVPRAAALEPWALDVSSGVEATPGRKDAERLRTFFAARRRLPERGVHR
ncbi:MAG: bifunctional indole-3-glycerol phosphate synthase/phosphoribosylanthranilate isomerase, partial [Gemmatimonadales bacterium]|nr:bifunctional indole-3-glycerol phosphate synthase/phosphoribosylanthranilate isomerase [Gemmatimonadales bacterium]